MGTQTIYGTGISNSKNFLIFRAAQQASTPPPRRQVKKLTAGRRTRPAGALQVVPRARLAAMIHNIIEEKELSQTSAGAVVNEAPSQISLLMSGHLAGFSTDRLVRMLLKLGRDVDVIVKRGPRGGRTGHVRVIEGPSRGPRAKRGAKRAAKRGTKRSATKSKRGRR